jgi:hypothetical protein
MSCPHTSPQNGKTEHTIQSTNNVIRSLLFQASLPARYWVEGLPTKTISVSCPHYALFGTPPTYEHLCVSGCECYPNMSSTAPHKLAPRSTHCIFLGYSEHHKGYRYLDLSTNRLVISRHVVFNEVVFLFVTSPHRTNDLNLLLSETAPMVPPIGARLPAGSTAPHTTMIMPEPSSLADEEAQANPLESPPQTSGHPPLVSRGPAVPVAPLDPTTPTPCPAPASTPDAPTRSAWPHRTLGDPLAPQEVFADPLAPGPQDLPVRPDGPLAWSMNVSDVG